MTEYIKQEHAISEDTVKKLNSFLEGSGWTVGLIFHQAGLLATDIQRARHDADFTVDIEESNKKSALVHELEKKWYRILADFKEG
jgi:hypothetical protein